MIWNRFQELGFYVFLFLTIYYIVRKDYVKLISLSFWGVSFACCFKFFITLWTPEKIVGLGMLFCIIQNGRQNRYRSSSKLATSLFLLILLSDIIGFLNPPEYAKYFNNYSRIYLQTFAYIIPISILVYKKLLPTGSSTTLYKNISIALGAGVLGGFAHFVFKLIGIPFMPINRGDGIGTNEEEVIAMMGDDLVDRIYGFAGEPKGLGFVAMSYIAIQLVVLGKSGNFSNKKLAILFLAFFVILNTYSSSALINLILLLPIVFFYLGIKLPSKARNTIIILMSVLLVISIVDSSSLQDFVSNLNGRTFERGQNELENDRQETVIWRYFQEESIITQMFGWGMGQYSFHIPNQIIGNRLIPVQSGLVLTLCDFGYVGIIFMLVILYDIFKVLSKAKNLANPLPAAFAVGALSKLIGCWMYGNLVMCLPLLMLSHFSLQDTNSLDNKLYNC